MPIRRPLAMLSAAGCLAVCLAGCGGGSGPVANGGPEPAPSTTVVGTYRIEGGVPPGINRPLSGPIQIHSVTASGPVVATTTATHGHFQVVLAPGRYVATGISARQSGTPCTSGPALSVGTGANVRLAVMCNVP